MDLSRPLRLHVVGVGGAGMSAIASVLAAMGHHVTGSDLKAPRGVDRLRALGVDVAIGHRPENVGQVDAVAISTAIAPTNPEVEAAVRRGIPVLRRAEILAAICATRRVAAVAGTHGKTTTSSMLAMVLAGAGLRPSFIVGGELNETRAGAAWDEGEWLVVEADESDGTFVELGTEAAVVTSVEPDHLEHYGDFDNLRAAFDRFLGEATGPRVVCADDPVAAELAQAHGAETYGTHEEASYRMVGLEAGRDGSRFTLCRGNEVLGELRLQVAGAHNARNAAGAAVAGLLLGAPFQAVADALARYAGVARRFEFRGEAAGVTFIDDYAHLPGEVSVALSAARTLAPSRLVCVFQPHRFSRTASLWQDFGPAFAEADLLVVTDVYAAGEAARPGVTGKLIVHSVLDAQPRKRVAYLPRFTDLAPYLTRELRPGDVCLTLGAGDLTLLPDELIVSLAPNGDRPEASV